MMNEKDDYFVNHSRATKFPFTLYHNPIAKHLSKFLKTIATKKHDAEVLVIGGGLMHELSQISPTLRLTVIDIDQRAIDAIAKLNHPVIKDLKTIHPDETPSILQKKYDAIYAKEVIEHIIPWQKYLMDARSSLVAKGRLWLSTPNYGEIWLPMIENTLLEMIAQQSNYSRKNIHPSKFSAKLLQEGLADAGFKNINLQTISYRLALVATGANG